MKDFDSNNELKELDKFFADTLKDASVKPSDDVWMNIETELDNKSKKRFLFWIIPSAILLVAFSVGYFVIPTNYFLSSNTHNSSSKTSSLPVETTTPQENKLVLDSERNLNETSTKLNSQTVKEISTTSNSNKNLSGTKTTSSAQNTIREDSFPLKNDNKKTYNSEVIKVQNSIDHKQNKASEKFAEIKSEPVKTSKQTVTTSKSNTNNEINTIPEKLKSEINSSYKGSKVENTSNSVNIDKAETSNTNQSSGQNKNLTSSDNKTLSEEKPGIENTSAVNQNTVEVLPPSVVGKNETLKKDTLINENMAPAKTDSTSSVKLQEPEKPKELFKRFGVYLLAGPEYAKPISTSFKEINPITIVGGIKLQYLLTKRFAIELGASYQTANSSSSDDTLYFQKNLTYDTYIHSSYGDMVVDPATLMQGFSTSGPFSTYRVKYSYKINYSVLNIPILLKFYPIKRDKLSVSAMVGINTQKIISQSTQLTIYREFNNNSTLNYNDLLSKTLSYSAIIGLGLEIKLYKNLNFVLEPNLRYGLKNLSASPSAKAKMLNFDGQAGLKLSF